MVNARINSQKGAKLRVPQANLVLVFPSLTACQIQQTYFCRTVNKHVKCTTNKAQRHKKGSFDNEWYSTFRLNSTIPETVLSTYISASTPQRSRLLKNCHVLCHCPSTQKAPSHLNAKNILLSS